MSRQRALRSDELRPNLGDGAKRPLEAWRGSALEEAIATNEEADFSSLSESLAV